MSVKNPFIASAKKIFITPTLLSVNLQGLPKIPVIQWFGDGKDIQFFFVPNFNLNFQATVVENPDWFEVVFVGKFNNRPVFVKNAIGSVKIDDNEYVTFIVTSKIAIKSGLTGHYFCTVSPVMFSGERVFPKTYCLKI